LAVVNAVPRSAELYASQQLTRLLEEHWKDWHVSGIKPKTGTPKPWQKEALRLLTEIEVLSRVYLTSVLL
jgi:hypothetical protein